MRAVIKSPGKTPIGHMTEDHPDRPVHWGLACGPEEAMDVIRLTGEEVLPAVRERHAG